MKHLFLILPLVLSSLFLLTCVDIIDLEPPSSLGEGVSIQGELIKGTPSVVEVRVSRLFNFDLKTLTPLQVKQVQLINEQNQIVDLQLSGRSLYRYVFNQPTDFPVEFGLSYKVRVELRDGKVYESTYEQLQPKSAQKSELSFEIGAQTIQLEDGTLSEVPIINFLVNTSIATDAKEAKQKLTWISERTYQLTDGLELSNFDNQTCYISAGLDFDEIKLLNGEDLTTDEVNKLKLSTVRLNHEFAEGYYYTTYERSLTDSAFLYFDRIRQLQERTGGLLEPAVGLLPTNLSNINDSKDANIYGYFTAFAQDTLRLYVSPEEVGNPNKLCPPRGIFMCWMICCDCTEEKESTVVKPDFWEE
ncbi:MAG: DUF4249 family protein [Bacteroidota bacterium]